MNDKERATMQQALEALEEMFHSNSTKVAIEKYNTAHTALREALDHIPDATKMVALTTEQAQQIEEALVFYDTEELRDEALATIRAAKAQEQAEQEQAEQEQAEQEPVGEVVMESMGVGDAQIVRFRMNGRIPPVGTKLYAAPVRTKDLPDDEVAKAYMECTGGDIIARCRAVIAADREKNRA